MVSESASTNPPATPVVAKTKQMVNATPQIVNPAAPLIASLSASYPMLLFPVRLETKFGSGASGPELWVRIFPDQIAIDTHDPSLSKLEVTSGQAYWTAIWTATGKNDPNSTNVMKSAWRALAGAFGPQRAAWITKALTPTNPSTDNSPKFPNVQTRNGSAQQSPQVRMLPDRWTVVTYAGGVPTHNVAGLQIPTPLPVDITPHFTSKQAKPDSSMGAAVPSTTAPVSPPVSPDPNWLFDFDQAYANGMAVRIQISQEEANTGFDKVVVLGVRGNADPHSSAQQVANLIDAHHFSDGFALVPQGTPTKNSPIASSGYDRRDQDYENSFTVERQAPLTSSSNCDSVRAADLLGIPLTTFDHIENADFTDQFEAQQMATALWPATLEYFLREMMQSPITSAQMNTLQEHFTTRVRGRGPIPAIRVGRTPYGILPVSSLALWNPRGSPDPVQIGLANIVRKSWPTWIASSGNTPRIRPVEETPGQPQSAGINRDKDLVQVMGMDASSVSYNARWGLGPDFVQAWLSFMGETPATLTAWKQTQASITSGTAGLLGVNPQSRIFQLNYAPSSYQVLCPNVQTGSLSETDPLRTDYKSRDALTSINYMQLLANASLTEIQSENYQGNTSKPNSLLYMILRQSLLLQQFYIAAQALIQAGSLQASDLAENEFVNFSPGKPSTTRWSIISKTTPPASTVDATRTATQQTKQVSTSTQTVVVGGQQLPPTAPTGAIAVSPQLQAQMQMQALLQYLSTLPTARLERLMSETLDLCSHRLDAWATSVATWLLDSQRHGTDGLTATTGLYIGGYGWVENLQPAASQTTGASSRQVASVTSAGAVSTNTSAIQSKSPAVSSQTGNPVLTQTQTASSQEQQVSANVTRTLPAIVPAPTDNMGFIHAPSLEQAATAAVIRNGYLTHQGTSEGKMLSIDLSSERMRIALWLLDGIRQGQSLGALLGYRFELGLHQNGLDTYIQTFRNAYPLVANKIVGASTSSSSPSNPSGVDELAQVQAMAASTVVDGVDLMNDYTTVPVKSKVTINPSDQSKINSVLSQIDMMLDALGDLSTTEAVFQLMRGNAERAGAIMNAVSRGDNPPEPAVLRTPRTGAEFTNRVFIMFPTPGNAPRAPAWSSVGVHVRATTEPTIDAWLSTILPDPTKIQCVINYTFVSTSSGQQQSQGSTTISVKDIDVGPLDFLAMANTGDTPGSSELEQRLIYHFYGQLGQNQIPSNATSPTIVFTRNPTWTQDILSFPEALAIVRNVRELVASCRALIPKDLIATGSVQPDGSSIDITDLSTRAGNLSTSLQNTILNLISSRNALLAAALNDQNTTNVMRSAMMDASWFGLVGCIPRVQFGTDSGPKSQLAVQAASVINQLEARQAVVLKGAFSATSVVASSSLLSPSSSPSNAQVISPPVADPNITVSNLIAYVQKILGKSFVVLPNFQIPADSKSDTGTSTAFSQTLQVDFDSASKWKQQLTHIRPAISRLDTAISACSVISGFSSANPVQSNLVISQLPISASNTNEQWLALPFKTDTNGNLTIPKIQGRVCLEALVFGPLPTSFGEVAGLMVDEWTERIPLPTVNTGIAFEYDEPRARTPQCLLLAVCPDQRTSWDIDVLTAIVNETIDLTHMRTVDYDLLGSGGQVLPLLHFAFNPNQGTISAAALTNMTQSAISTTSNKIT